MPASDSHKGATGAPTINITEGAITVNGGGGSPEQNADLARQIAREHGKGMRVLIQDEMTKQMRTGGLLRR